MIKSALTLGQFVHTHCVAAMSGGLAVAEQVADKLGYRDVGNLLKLKAMRGVYSTSTWNVPGLMADTVLADLPYTSYQARLAAESQDYGLHNIILASDNSSLVATEIEEWQAIDLPPGFSVGRLTISPSKVALMTGFTRELVSSGAAVAAITNLLVRAVDQGLSAAVISRQLPGSSGGIAASSDALADMRKLLGALATTGATKAVCCTDPETAILMSTLKQGVLTFPAMTPNGGEACGVGVSVSDRVNSGDIIACDPQAIAFSRGSIDVQVSQNASAVLDTAASYGDGTVGQQLVSAFQSSFLLCRVMVRFSYTELRPEHVTESLESVEWANS